LTPILIPCSSYGHIVPFHSFTVVIPTAAPLTTVTIVVLFYTAHLIRYVDMPLRTFIPLPIRTMVFARCGFVTYRHHHSTCYTCYFYDSLFWLFGSNRFIPRFCSHSTTTVLLPHLARHYAILPYHHYHTPATPFLPVPLFPQITVLPVVLRDCFATYSFITTRAVLRYPLYPLPAVTW